MADINSLRRQINSLQKTIKNLEKEQRKFRKQALNDQRNELIRIEREYQDALRRNQQNAEQQYKKALKELQTNILTSYRVKLDSIRKQLQENQRKQDLKYKELEDHYSELREKFENQVKQKRERNALFKQKAEDTLSETITLRDITNKRAHEFFCGNQFLIINNSIDATNQLINSEMFEAAIAQASSLGVQFNLLSARIDKELSEWKAIFDDYVEFIEFLKERIDDFIKDQKKFYQDYYDDYLDNKELLINLDFWSLGNFIKIKNRIEALNKEIEDIKELGIEAYLKDENNKPKQKQGFVQGLVEAQQLNDHLNGLFKFILHERAFADERIDISEQIIEILKPIGYKLLESGFLDRNPFNAFESVFSLQGDQNSLIIIRVTPVRQDGVTIHNEIIISTEFYGVQSSKDQLNILNRLVQIFSRNINIQTSIIAPDGKSSENLQIITDKRQSVPDVEKQMELEEKKYSIN